MPDQKGTRRPVLWFALLGAALALSFVAAVTLGPVLVPADLALEALFSPNTDPGSLDAPLRRVYTILWHIRFPRAAAALLAGTALAAAGAVVQGLFRNPLASPDILGITAGSSLGAVIAIVTGTAAVDSFALPASSFLGAAAAAGFVYLIAARRGGTNLLRLILAGLAVSSLLGALVSGILMLSEEYAINQFVLWTMGGLDETGWEMLKIPGICIAVLVVLVSIFAHALDALSLGDEQAHGLGMNVELVRLFFLGAAAMLTAMAVSIAGPIAFVGLMVPHAVRLAAGPNHRSLVPLSILAGGSYLLLCDTAARLILAPREIKTGIVTALLGGPYFIVLILRRRRTGTL